MAPWGGDGRPLAMDHHFGRLDYDSWGSMRGPDAHSHRDRVLLVAVGCCLGPEFDNNLEESWGFGEEHEDFDIVGLAEEDSLDRQNAAGRFLDDMVLDGLAPYWKSWGDGRCYHFCFVGYGYG